MDMHFRLGGVMQCRLSASWCYAVQTVREILEVALDKRLDPFNWFDEIQRAVVDEKLNMG